MPDSRDNPAAGSDPALDRRRFLGSALAAVAAALPVPAWATGDPARGASGVLSAGGAAGFAFARLDRIGVQLWTVRQDLERDFEGTLARLRAIGYREVEFENYFGRSAQEVRRIVKAHGLTAPGTHITFERLRDEPEKVMAEAREAGHHYVVFRFLEEKDRTPEGYARVIETLNRAGDVARRAGLVLAYHNHASDLAPLPDGTRPYDLILARTDPGRVRMELDVRWVLKGGGRPQDYFARWPGRFPLLHLQDFDAADHTVDAGRGLVDFAGVLAERRRAGVRHVFVEYEDAPDPWTGLANTYAYLAGLRFKEV